MHAPRIRLRHALGDTQSGQAGQAVLVAPREPGRPSRVLGTHSLPAHPGLLPGLPGQEAEGASQPCSSSRGLVVQGMGPGQGIFNLRSPLGLIINLMLRLGKRLPDRETPQWRQRQAAQRDSPGHGVLCLHDCPRVKNNNNNKFPLIGA